MGLLDFADDVRAERSGNQRVSPFPMEQGEIKIPGLGFAPQFFTYFSVLIQPSYGGATTGTTFLKSRGLQVEEYWYWISIGALVLLSFIYNLGFLACCVYLNRK